MLPIPISNDVPVLGGSAGVHLLLGSPIAQRARRAGTVLDLRPAHTCSDGLRSVPVRLGVLTWVVRTP